MIHPMKDGQKSEPTSHEWEALKEAGAMGRVVPSKESRGKGTDEI